VIAVAGGGTTSTTSVAPVTTTTKAGSTSPTTGGSGGSGAKPVTASSSSLAFTGVGPGIGILGVIGGVLILLGFALLVLVDAPRRALSQLAFLGQPSTWRRGRAGDLTDRLANLNPMGWRKAHNEGVPDTSLTESPQPQEVQPQAVQTAQPEARSWAPSSTQSRGMNDRFSRVEAVSREWAQTTARHAVRTAQWLLGR
jgi:hypothetical protein